MNIEKEIKENQALLLLTSRSKYASSLVELMKDLDKNFKKIGYVNLNKSYKTLKKSLVKNKINLSKIFVMGLNKPTNAEKEIENYQYIGSADNLGGINIAFSDFVYWGCKIFLFDSVSLRSKAFLVRQYMPPGRSL